MSGLSASQLLFYGGIGVMALTVLAAVCAFCALCPSARDGRRAEPSALPLLGAAAADRKSVV